jgi:PHD/YefM family antitoxin component YafN of YafNO toxin-antitoxin module
MNITSNSELQKNIGQISKSVEHDFTIINTRGKPKMVILPYFENNDDFIADYMESYFLHRNKDKLINEAKKSLKSGLSDLEI